MASTSARRLTQEGESKLLWEMPVMKFDWADYRRFVQTYPFSPCESRSHTHWLDCQKIRHGLVLSTYARHRSSLGASPQRLLDIGAYPGSLVKAIRLYLKETCTIEAVGLAQNADFLEDMERHGIGFSRANLDPLVGSYQPVEEVATRLPLIDGSCDAVFITEMIEHTLDPLYVLREIARVLRPGGLMFLTTPNQAVFSHRLRLLAGRSIYYQLHESIMYRQVDWRPHFREYTMAEMTTLVRDGGFEVIETSFMDLTDDDERIWGWKRPLLRLGKELARIFMRFPSLRHGLFVVGRRLP